MPDAGRCSPPRSWRGVPSLALELERVHRPSAVAGSSATFPEPAPEGPVFAFFVAELRAHARELHAQFLALAPGIVPFVARDLNQYFPAFTGGALLRVHVSSRVAREAGGARPPDRAPPPGS